MVSQREQEPDSHGDVHVRVKAEVADRLWVLRRRKEPLTGVIARLLRVYDMVTEGRPPEDVEAIRSRESPRDYSRRS